MQTPQPEAAQWPIAPGYTELDASMSPAQSELAGAFRVQSVDEAALYGATGTVDHEAGGLKFKVGNYTFKSKQGFGSGGVVSDSRGVILTLFGSNAPTRFSALYTASTTDPSIAATGVGVIGIPTLVTDMPMSGEATFRGHGQIGLVSARQPNYVANATVAGVVDFQRQKASVTIAALNSTQAAPFDTYIIDEMDIGGNSTDGGTVSLEKNAAQVSPVGPVVGTVSKGYFFGAVELPDGRLRPAEFGGSSLTRAADGFAFSTFLGNHVRE